jgi:predicted ATPase
MHLMRARIHGDRFPSERLYPFNILSIGGTQELLFHHPVAFFLGENGTGKSTLLDAISRKCGLHVWDKPRRHPVHDNPYETRLVDFVTITWSSGSVPGSVFRAETYRDLADFFDDVALCDPGRLQYQGGRILNTLSHGEGTLSYFGGRLQRKGLYLLDEPESALSPTSQVRFLQLLQHIVLQGDAQFIIATHSPILLSYPGAQILSFDGARIEEVAYEDTTHYKIYRQLFADHAAFLTTH